MKGIRYVFNYMIFEVLRIHFCLSCKGEGGKVKGIQYVYNYK